MPVRSWGVRVVLRDGTTRLIGPFPSKEAAASARPGGPQVVVSALVPFRDSTAPSGVPRILQEKATGIGYLPTGQEPEGPEPTWLGDAQGALTAGLPSFLFIDVWGRDDDANLIDPELVSIRVTGNNGGPDVTEIFPITDPFFENYIRIQPVELQQFGVDNPNITLVELLNGADEVQQELTPFPLTEFNFNSASSPAPEWVQVNTSGVQPAAIRLQSGSTFHGDGADNWFDQVVANGPNTTTFACPGTSGFANDILWLFDSNGVPMRVGANFTVS